MTSLLFPYPRRIPKGEDRPQVAMNSAITGCEHPAPLVSVGRREREKDEGQMERKKEA